MCQSCHVYVPYVAFALISPKSRCIGLSVVHARALPMSGLDSAEAQLPHHDGSASDEGPEIDQPLVGAAAPAEPSPDTIVTFGAAVVKHSGGRNWTIDPDDIKVFGPRQFAHVDRYDLLFRKFVTGCTRPGLAFTELVDSMIALRIRASESELGINNNASQRKKTDWLVRKEKAIIKRHNVANLNKCVNVVLPSFTLGGVEISEVVTQMPFDALNKSDLHIELAPSVVDWIMSKWLSVRDSDTADTPKPKRKAVHPPVDGVYWHRAHRAYAGRSGKNDGKKWRVCKPDGDDAVSISAAADKAVDFKSGVADPSDE